MREQAGVTQRELARRAGTSQAAVARYESGDAPPVLELVMSHRERIVALAAAKGASNVRLFGSAARGGADDLSDIDFLVDFDTAHGLWPMIELADDLESLLGRPVDVAPLEMLKPAVAERALSEALPL